jgi:hypothetical protein
MENWISLIKPYLEALNLLSAVVIAICALIALRQIKLLKIDITSRSERAAKEKAIDAAFEYAGALEELRRNVRKEDFDLAYGGPLGDFSLASIPASHLEPARNRFHHPFWIGPVNRFDGIAATFITGVADEGTAFPIFGWAFCGTVAKLYDVICLDLERSKGKSLSNLIMLYDMWSSRLSKYDLEQARKTLDEQIEGMIDRNLPPLSPFA